VKNIHRLFLHLFPYWSLKKIIWLITTCTLFSFLAGWQLAFLLLSMISFHEMGHLWAARKYGIETAGFTLTPFGGIARLADCSSSQKQEVVISIMGPIWGALYAVVCLAVGRVWDIEFFINGAVIVSFINLFNLLPFFPLDGGRIARAFVVSISPRVGNMYGILSLAGIVLIFIFFFRHPVLLFLAWLGFQEVAATRKLDKILDYVDKTGIEAIKDKLKKDGCDSSELNLTVDQIDRFRRQRGRTSLRGWEYLLCGVLCLFTALYLAFMVVLASQ
jgi:Zn-dependent protease